MRVLVRHPEKVAPLAQTGVEIFPGDLDSPESIDQAMRGVSRAAGIAQTSSFSTATGGGRIGHVDVRDVAACAAEIAVSPAGRAGKTYWPTGPESLSGYDVAEIFAKVLSRPITFHPISDAEPNQQKGDLVTMDKETTGRTKHLLALMTRGDDLFNARDWQALDDVHHPDMIAFIPGSAEPIYGREAHGAAMKQLVRMFPDVRVHTPYPIQFGGDDWITAVTNATGTFTGDGPARRQRNSADRKGVRPRVRPDQQVGR